MDFLYGDSPGKLSEAWTNNIKKRVIKLKANKHDDTETDFIDVDYMLSAYLEEYKTIRRRRMGEIRRKFDENLARQEEDGASGDAVTTL